MNGSIDDALISIVRQFANPTFQAACAEQDELLLQTFGFRMDSLSGAFRRALGQVLSDHNVLSPELRRKQLVKIYPLVHPDRSNLDKELDATRLMAVLAMLRDDEEFLTQPLEAAGISHAQKPGGDDERVIGDQLGKIFFRGLIDVDSDAGELSKRGSGRSRPLKKIVETLQQNYEDIEDEGHCSRLLSQFLSSLMRSVGREVAISVEIMDAPEESTLPVLGNVIFVNDKIRLLRKDRQNPFEDLIFWFLSYAHIPSGHPLRVLKDYIQLHTDLRLKSPVRTVVKTVEGGLASFHPLDLLSEKELSELSDESRTTWLGSIAPEQIDYRWERQASLAVSRLIEATPLDPEFSKICTRAGELIRGKNLVDILQGWGEMTRDTKKRAINVVFTRIHECFMSAVSGLKGSDVPIILFGVPNSHFYHYDHQVAPTNYSHHTLHYNVRYVTSVGGTIDHPRNTEPKGEIVFIPSVACFPPRERRFSENPLWDMSDLNEVIEHLIALCFRSFYDHRIPRVSHELGILTDLRARRSTDKSARGNDYAQIDKLTPNVYPSPSAGEMSMRILAANPRERWLKMVLNHVNRQEPTMISSFESPFTKAAGKTGAFSVQQSLRNS